MFRLTTELDEKSISTVTDNGERANIVGTVLKYRKYEYDIDGNLQIEDTHIIIPSEITRVEAKDGNSCENNQLFLDRDNQILMLNKEDSNICLPIHRSSLLRDFLNIEIKRVNEKVAFINSDKLPGNTIKFNDGTTITSGNLFWEEE